ncbi:MAG: hypothetical protein ABSE52_00950 [Candidatus Dormibacteria bacterium]|jgi:hypothetical protein
MSTGRWADRVRRRDRGSGDHRSGQAASLARLGIGALLLVLGACAPATSTMGTPPPGSTPLLPATLPPPTPTPTPPASPVALPSYQAGVNLLFYANSGYPTGLPQLLTELHQDGVNSIAVTFPFYQASLTADSVATGTGTPPDQQLEGLIDTMEGDGFSVMLRPLMDETDLAPEWRGAIAPRSVAAWFASYTTLVSHYAQMAATTHAQAFDIGSELYSLEPLASDWGSLISAVRAVYTGALTYSVNGTSETSGTLYDGFWKDLDFVSVDAYWDLGVPDGTGVNGLVQAWQPFLAKMTTAAAGQRVVLSEVGVAPQKGEQDHPWETPLPGPTDAAFQETYYQAACQAAEAAAVSGIYWWEVNLGAPGSFDPLGTPAEQALAACFTSGG